MTACLLEGEWAANGAWFVCEQCEQVASMQQVQEMVLLSAKCLGNCDKGVITWWFIVLYTWEFTVCHFQSRVFNNLLLYYLSIFAVQVHNKAITQD